jgi:hypothetical protein
MSPYGSGGTPTDLGRVPAKAPRQSHGLRGGDSTDGWYPAYQAHYRPARVAPVRVRQTKPKPVKGLDPATNLVGPKDDDSTPIRRFESTTTTVQDMAGIVPTIRMGEWI